MDAVSVKSIGNFLLDGSSVYATALDISKAFDSVDHCKLFSSFLDEIPALAVTIICNWYSKFFVSVCRN